MVTWYMTSYNKAIFSLPNASSLVFFSKQLRTGGYWNNIGVGAWNKANQ